MSIEQQLTDKEIALLSFEDAMSRLEALLQHVENGEVGLEQSLELYAQGKKLETHCQSILNRVSERMAELAQKPDGTLTEKA